MADRNQNFANHKRFLAPWHFFAFPVLLLNVFVQARGLLDGVTFSAIWNVLVALAITVAVFLSRTMALTAQNRSIRIEERARLERTLPPELRTRAAELRDGQLVALRFASDEELPDLTRRCLAGEFTTGAELKKSIKSWRPDYSRV